MRIILVALALLLQAACAIKSYSPSVPADIQPVLAGERFGTLSFTYLTNERDGSNLLPQKPEAVQRSWHSTLDTVCHSVIWPSYVTLSYGPPPFAWVYIAHQTFYLIPGYFNGIAYEVQFDVFADNRLTHIYRHEIKLQSIGWIGLLPFVVWVICLPRTSLKPSRPLSISL